MKKKIGILSAIVLCLTVFSYFYLSQNKSPKKEKESVYMKTVVFKDKEDELIPVSLNFHSQVDKEEEIRNRIDVMKSNEFVQYGLYPVLSPQLEINSLSFHNKTLTIDFNDELYSNQDAMDILETLSFTMTDYDNVENLKLKINGKDITHLPNSAITTSCLTKRLGLNNFEETSSLLHETQSVMVYSQKQIEQFSYYVPTTIRVNENESLQEQVKTILHYISQKIHLVDAVIDNGILTVELDSNILLDNEKIDQTLEDLIVLSLSSLENIKDVEIKINGEDARSKKTSEIYYNYLKI